MKQLTTFFPDDTIVFEGYTMNYQKINLFNNDIILFIEKPTQYDSSEELDYFYRLTDHIKQLYLNHRGLTVSITFRYDTNLNVWGMLIEFI